jgi:hypothetical protein
MTAMKQAVITALVIIMAPALVHAQPDTAWVRRFDGNAHSSDYLSSSAVDRQGNVYVTGFANDTGSGMDYLTIKYRPNGDTAWARTYNGPGNDMDAGRGIKVDNAGNVFVTGESQGSGTGVDFATIKYDSLGTQLWVSRYNSPGDTDDRADAIALDQSGDCYVAGMTVTPDSGIEYLIVKYGPGGDTLWSRRYGSGSNGDDEAYMIAVDSAGNAYVTGGDAVPNVITLKYNPSGTQVWAGSHPGWANGIALGNSGKVFVAGAWNSPTGREDWLTIAYDAVTGDTSWVATFDGPAHDNDDASAVAVGASGRIYVTGYSTRDTVNWNQDFLTIGYQPNGDTAWVRRVPGPYPGGTDYSEAIALDSAENVYACGYGQDSAGNNASMAVSYDAGGAWRWLARYTGPGGGGGEWTTVNTFGSSAVYFAGYSFGIGTSTDYTVAKYAIPSGIAGPGQPAGHALAPWATIVHGTLNLPRVTDASLKVRSVLLDVSGRAKAQLAPGANDVSRFAPGVYFVRQTTITGASTKKVVFE